MGFNLVLVPITVRGTFWTSFERNPNGESLSKKYRFNKLWYSQISHGVIEYKTSDLSLDRLENWNQIKRTRLISSWSFVPFLFLVQKLWVLLTPIWDRFFHICCQLVSTVDYQLHHGGSTTRSEQNPISWDLTAGMVIHVPWIMFLSKAIPQPSASVIKSEK